MSENQCFICRNGTRIRARAVFDAISCRDFTLVTAQWQIELGLRFSTFRSSRERSNIRWCIYYWDRWIHECVAVSWNSSVIISMLLTIFSPFKHKLTYHIAVCLTSTGYFVDEELLSDRLNDHCFHFRTVLGRCTVCRCLAESNSIL